MPSPPKSVWSVSGHHAPGGGAGGLAAPAGPSSTLAWPREKTAPSPPSRPGAGNWNSGQEAAAGRRPPLPGLGRPGRRRTGDDHQASLLRDGSRLQAASSLRTTGAQLS